jgi:cytochrome c1
LQNRATAIALTGGDPDHAAALLVRYGCAGCHAIPGVPGADGKVGSSLADLRERVYVGGVARNTAANLVGWIVDPQRYSPRSAMPATGITPDEARDVAAYLYAH